MPETKPAENYSAKNAAFKEAFRKAQEKGDDQEAEKALSQMCALNDGLAVKEAGRFADRNVHSDDYMQAAREELIKAFLAWDPARAEFSTFATDYIRGGVRRAVNKAEGNGISYGDWSAKPAVQRELEANPHSSDAEVADAIGITASTVSRIRAAGDLQHLDALPVEVESPRGVLDVSDAGQDLLHSEGVKDAFAGAKPMELFAWRLAVDDLDYGTIGRMAGLSRESARRAAKAGAQRTTKHLTG